MVKIITYVTFYMKTFEYIKCYWLLVHILSADVCLDLLFKFAKFDANSPVKIKHLYLLRAL